MTEPPAGPLSAPADPRLYRRIAATLQEQITTGQLAPGAALPTSDGLAGQHQCSPQTALKALHFLSAEGFAQRIPGMGYCAGERPAGQPGFPDPRPYRQIADRFRQQITQGTLRPGDPLPSIASIRRESGHSRHTVSKAMHLLVVARH